MTMKILIIFAVLLCSNISYSNDKCVTLSLSNITDKYLTEMSKERINDAIQVAEKQLGIRILSRKTNVNSLKYLEMGYPSKPIDLKAKTAATGIIAGLIPLDQRLSKADEDHREDYERAIKKAIQDKRYLAVNVVKDGYIAGIDSEGKQDWYPNEEKLPEGVMPIQVVADSTSHLPVTGDNDLALITREPQDESAWDDEVTVRDERGIESVLERSARNATNKAYLESAQLGGLTQKKMTNQIINHGPESRNPVPSLPDYPWVDSSGEEILQGPGADVHSNLRKYLKKLVKNGYYFEVPEQWRRVMGLERLPSVLSNTQLSRHSTMSTDSSILKGSTRPRDLRSPSDLKN